MAKQPKPPMKKPSAANTSAAKSKPPAAKKPVPLVWQAPHFDNESRLRGSGLWPVAGIDEAGRGPLCGPVVAAAVILDPACIPPGLADSKQLTPQQRETAFAAIMADAIAVGIGFSPADEIDRINIRQATHAAMRRALAALAIAPVIVLIDGNDQPAGLTCAAETLVKGDAISVSIAAASIVAKVTRDRLMHRMSAWHPEYGFADHVGYATKQHVEAMAIHGPCVFHRRSFGSLKELI
ncbi:ribonuclease HII [Roseiarcaceae bacterium H3SJ34-1]|uniref:ribonuclease HII n=1 Tax=Terripilifer ovatus TaxID=3032367 RepID=UPI003AB9ADAD|nr:ribonuclease HII [Roseiarcaceae bacterium H3SJ34-1]